MIPDLSLIETEECLAHLVAEGLVWTGDTRFVGTDSVEGRGVVVLRTKLGKAVRVWADKVSFLSLVPAPRPRPPLGRHVIQGAEG